eukprot:scaffold22577_cov122-Cylindrotheca_fusiformis.AAC.11
MTNWNRRWTILSTILWLIPSLLDAKYDVWTWERWEVSKTVMWSSSLLITAAAPPLFLLGPKRKDSTSTLPMVDYFERVVCVNSPCGRLLRTTVADQDDLQ